MTKGRDLDWLVFNRRKFIGSYIVQFKSGEGFSKLYDIAKITDITMNDFAFFLKTDQGVWFTYLFDNVILPEITEEEDNIVIDDKLLDIKCLILLKNRPK